MAVLKACGAKWDPGPLLPLMSAVLGWPHSGSVGCPDTLSLCGGLSVGLSVCGAECVTGCLSVGLTVCGSVGVNV